LLHNHVLGRAPAWLPFLREGELAEMEVLADRCMADYDEEGWRHAGYSDGADISILGKLGG